MRAAQIVAKAVVAEVVDAACVSEEFTRGVLRAHLQQQPSSLDRDRAHAAAAAA